MAVVLKVELRPSKVALFVFRGSIPMGMFRSCPVPKQTALGVLPLILNLISILLPCRASGLKNAGLVQTFEAYHDIFFEI